MNKTVKLTCECGFECRVPRRFTDASLYGALRCPLPGCRGDLKTKDL